MDPRIESGRDSFRSLFEQHRQPVYRYLYRLTGNRHDAEDLLQETFARYWRKQDQFRGDGSVGGYLRSIAFRIFLNARTRLQRSRSNGAATVVEPPCHTAGPAAGAEQRDLDAFLCGRVRRAVDELPDSWRDAFVLFRYEGLTMKEIASQLDITPKAVELRLARAMRRLREQLGDLIARYGERGTR